MDTVEKRSCPFLSKNKFVKCLVFPFFFFLSCLSVYSAVSEAFQTPGAKKKKKYKGKKNERDGA